MAGVSGQEKPQGISLVLPPATCNKVGLLDGSEPGALDLSFPMREVRVILCSLFFVLGFFLTSQGCVYSLSKSSVLSTSIFRALILRKDKTGL